MAGPVFAIALYIPDETERAIREQRILRGLVDGAGLDFVVAGWWERAYTARLLVLPPEDSEARGVETSEE